MSDEPPEFIELMQELEEHPFQNISDRLHHVTYILYILERNFDLLSGFFDDHVANTSFLFDDPLSRKMKIQKELYRLMHNYLASYYSQYGFTKSLRDAKLGAEGRREYSDLMEKHNIRPTSDFLIAVRNIIQHQMLINAGPTFRWNRETGAEPIELKVFREDLEEHGLRAGATRFLKQYGEDEISLINVVEEHHADLIAFHDDFRDLVIDEHEDDLEEYMEIQERMNEDAREAFGTEQPE